MLRSASPFDCCINFYHFSKNVEIGKTLKNSRPTSNQIFFLEPISQSCWCFLKLQSILGKKSLINFSLSLTVQPWKFFDFFFKKSKFWKSRKMILFRLVFQLLPFFKKHKNWKNFEKIPPHLQPKIFPWTFFPKLLMFFEISINFKPKILNKLLSISYRSATKIFWFLFKKIKILKISQNVPEIASSNFVIYPLQPKPIVFEILGSQFPLQ